MTLDESGDNWYIFNLSAELQHSLCLCKKLWTGIKRSLLPTFQYIQLIRSVLREAGGINIYILKLCFDYYIHKQADPYNRPNIVFKVKHKCRNWDQSLWIQNPLSCTLND